jgi:glycosyltransferase involved in cell wall biosynthesis
MRQREGSRNRLRVAHVALQLDMGGMEKLLVEFARHTDREKVDLRFVSLNGRGGLADDIEACGWPVQVLHKGAGVRPPLVLDLARLFHSWKVDVVHTHNNGPLLYAAPAARLARVPAVIHTRHGRSFGMGRRQMFAVRLASALADQFVCVSEDSRALSFRQGIPRRKLSRLWNGIDLSRFRFHGPQDGGPAVLVARLNPEKDVATLLRAAALAVRQCPSFRLEIAGDGPSLPSLRALAAELGLDEQVRFLGVVRDVPGLLARASLFILPSLSEGVSLTLLEAMASGLPVVCTWVGGNPEIVIDGQTGFLVPTSSPEALAEKMVFLQARPELTRMMGLAGRRRAEEHFDVHGMLDRYERLYRGVLARARG